jgi:hypothetical protein
MAVVEQFGDHIVPWKYVTTKYGEGVVFDHCKAVVAIIKAYGLTEIAKTELIRFAQATDGFQITKQQTCMMGGAKIQHYSAICPLSGMPIMCEDPNDIQAQSRQHCFPFELFLCKETKETTKFHAPMGEFFRDCGDPLKNPLAYLGYMGLDVAINSDMSGTWKLFDKGGAMKVKRLPCINCAILSEKCHEPNATICDRWCKELHTERSETWETWRCYHHEMLSPEKVEDMQQEMIRLSEVLTVSLEELDRKTKFPKNEDPDVARPNAPSNPKSIHFVPQNMADKMAFSKYITDELILRALEIEGDLVTRRQRLRDALRAEQQSRNLLHKIKHGTPVENALFCMMQAVPCILHCSNRTNLKLLTVLLTEGLNYAKSKKILSEHAGQKKRVEAFLLAVETIVNKSILGTATNPSQWSLPTDGDNVEDLVIGAITMDNGRTVNIADNLELIVDLCIPESLDATTNQKWKRMMPHYRSAMIKMRQKTDFTDDDISEFQEQFDLFHQDWVGMYGIKALTNYIHLLSSGHMSDYLFKWRNLYLHSQQGWESLNNLVKIFFFRRTGRGGGKYGKSKLKPLARWLQRRLIWLCGYTWEEMLAFHESEEARKTAEKAAAAAGGTTQEEKESSDEDDSDESIEMNDEEENELLLSNIFTPGSGMNL